MSLLMGPCLYLGSPFSSISCPSRNLNVSCYSGRSPGLSPLAQSSPRGRKRTDGSSPDGEADEDPPPPKPPVEKHLETEQIAAETAKVLTKLHDLDFDVFE